MFERGRDAAAGVTGHITHTLGFAGTFQQTAADKAINLVDACVTVPLALTEASYTTALNVLCQEPF